MNVYETIGLTWVIFTSVLATVMLAYLAMLGVRAALKGVRNVFEAEAGDVVGEAVKLVTRTGVKAGTIPVRWASHEIQVSKN